MCSTTQGFFTWVLGSSVSYVACIETTYLLSRLPAAALQLLLLLCHIEF